MNLILKHQYIMQEIEKHFLSMYNFTYTNVSLDSYGSASNGVKVHGIVYSLKFSNDDISISLDNDEILKILIDSVKKDYLIDLDENNIEIKFESDSDHIPENNFQLMIEF